MLCGAACDAKSCADNVAGANNFETFKEMNCIRGWISTKVYVHIMYIFLFEPHAPGFVDKMLPCTFSESRELRSQDFGVQCVCEVGGSFT